MEETGNNVSNYDEKNDAELALHRWKENGSTVRYRANIDHVFGYNLAGGTTLFRAV